MNTGEYPVMYMSWSLLLLPTHPPTGTHPSTQTTATARMKAGAPPALDPLSSTSSSTQPTHPPTHPPLPTAIARMKRGAPPALDPISSTQPPTQPINLLDESVSELQDLSISDPSDAAREDAVEEEEQYVKEMLDRSLAIFAKVPTYPPTHPPTHTHTHLWKTRWSRRSSTSRRCWTGP